MLSLAPMNYGVPCPRLSVCHVSGSAASLVTTAAMKSIFGYTPGRRLSSGLLIYLGILYTTTTKTNRNGWRSPKSSHINQMYGNKAHITRSTKIVPDYDTIATLLMPCLCTRCRAPYASQSENNLRMFYTSIFLADFSDAFYP
jgi:hypothetical protein